MRNIAVSNGMVYYPESVAFRQDANFIIFRPTVASSYLVLTVTVEQGTELRILSNQSGGDEILVDISYALKTMVDGAVTLYIRSETDTQLSEISVSTTVRDGYTLPNRKHYDDTVAYVPPLNVFNKIHPEAEKQWVEFGVPSIVVMNGELYEEGDTFKVHSDGCDATTTVDVPYNYEPWESIGNTNNGITHIIIDRIKCMPAVQSWLEQNTGLTVGCDMLEDGEPANEFEVLASVQAKVVDGSHYKVQKFQYTYANDVVQASVNNVELVFDVDLFTEDFAHGTSGRSYKFDFMVDGVFVGYGMMMFCPTSVRTVEPYKAVRFMINVADDANVVAPLVDDRESHYDYSAMASISGVGERAVELKCLQYGWHYHTNVYGVLDDTNLLWMPYGGGDGYGLMSDFNGILYVGTQGVYPYGVPRIELGFWYASQYIDNFYRYRVEDKQILSVARVTTRPMKRYNRATPWQRFTNGVQYMDLKSFVLYDANGNEMCNYTVPALISDDAEFTVYHYPLQQIINGVITNVDIDGTPVANTIFVKAVCSGDLVDTGGGDYVGGTATVYDENGVELGEVEYIQHFNIFKQGDDFPQGAVEYHFLPFTCALPALKQEATSTDILMPASFILINENDEEGMPYLHWNYGFKMDFDLGRTVVRNGVTIVPQPVLPIWYYPQTGSYSDRYMYVDGTAVFSVYNFRYALEQTPIMKCSGLNGDRYIYSLNDPCAPSESDFFYQGVSPSQNQYTISTYGSCSGHIVWLNYKNHDGLERWMPCMALTNSFKTTFKATGVYRPFVAPVNAFADKTVGKIEERMELVASNIPRGAHIEDMFMASGITAFNEDGTLAFPATIEDEEVSVDLRKEDDDYKFTILKKV